ncbi:hypothetical protein EDB80DRAFT_679210 [Ilyonectria destructans]|nr:hypothetical protein EDB80DRAFT_679210 [Ilyonectria destructans]
MRRWIAPPLPAPPSPWGGLEKVGGNIGGVTWQAKAEDSTSSICSPATTATGTCGNPCPVGRRQAGNGSDKSPRGSGILMSRIGVGGQWTISVVGWWPHHGSIKVDRSTRPLSSAKPNIIDFISPVLSVQFRLRTPQQSQGSLSHAAMPCVANTLAENECSWSRTQSSRAPEPSPTGPPALRCVGQQISNLRLTSSPPPALPDVRCLTVSTSSVLNPLCLPFPPAPAARASAPNLPSTGIQARRSPRPRSFRGTIVIRTLSAIRTVTGLTCR